MKIVSTDGKLLYSDDSPGMDETVKNALSKGAALNRAILSYINLYGFDAENVQLQEAVLYKVTWTKGTVKGGNFSDAVFVQCPLDGWTLKDAVANRVAFFGSSLMNATIERAKMSKVVFTMSNVDGLAINGEEIPGLMMAGITSGKSLKRAQIFAKVNGTTHQV